jgi:hypothetical protein
VCIELHKKFDVAELSKEDVDYLQEQSEKLKAVKMRNRVREAYETGEILKPIQKRLASHRNGTFYAWCEQEGYSPIEVKRAIQVYEFIGTLCTNKEKDEYFNLPITLMIEASKRNAPEELKERVASGDIVTNKQWQEEMKAMKERAEQAERAKEQAERRAEQAEQANEALSEQYNEQAEQLQDLRNNPQVVEVPTEPSDYQTLKLDVESLTSANERLQRELAKAQAHKDGKSLQQKAEEDEAFAKYIKTKHQEADAADTFDRAISKLDMLPDDLPEVKEYCRCYLAHHATETNRAFLMKSTAQKIRLNIRKLEAALEMFETGKLEVVK